MFQIACFWLAVHMTVKFGIQYLENNDASVVTINRFNQKPSDAYPAFSFCLKGTAIHWYHKLAIFDAYSINVGQYESLLKGEEAFKYLQNESLRSYSKIPVSYGDGSSRNFDKFHLDVADFMYGLKFVSERKEETFNYLHGKSVGEQPFYISYHTTDMICFSRNPNDSLNSIRISDLLTFNSSILGQDVYRDAEIQIFVHYPSHLLNSFDNSRYKAQMGFFARSLLHGQNGHKQSPKILELSISQAKILRKRTDANVPCNDEIRDYDKFLKLQIINELNCIPIYWNPEFEKDLDLGICQSQTELKKAFEYTAQIKSIIDSNDNPCEDMILQVTSKINQHPLIPPNDISVAFLYTDKYYEEIAYIRAFGFESFFSGVGGFVGIFLGYSMMQLPELFGYTFGLFYQLMSWMCRQKNSKNHK